MIRIGNQTACYAATLMAPFDYAISRGFTAFEWFPDKKSGAGWDEGDIGGSLRQSIRETAAARGMRLSVHAHWMADCSMASLSKDLALAADLGATLFNIHLSLDSGMDAFVEAISFLIDKTSKAGLQLAIENTPHHSPENFNELFARLRSLNLTTAGPVGMCLDMGHANLCSATRNDYLKFVDRLDASVPILHLHLHENWGDSDTHLPLFTGPSRDDESGMRGLVDRLQRRKYSGSIILEQWPNPPGLLDQARDKLVRLLGASSGPAIGMPEAPCVVRGDFEGELVEANRHCRSWREKLDMIRGLLAREAEKKALTADKLVSAAVFLRFLGVGEIPCAEDGRHFRPSHHARIASQIRQMLALESGSEFIVRQILPWLPSTAREFQRAEPLTRIRDIAHRNDISHELKTEIKNTLQNKLHRCAGPEDLATSQKLLDRISAPGSGCPADFVGQFQLFHTELEAFFNAQPLFDRLAAMLPYADAAVAGAITDLLALKDSEGRAGRAFVALTRLRQALRGPAPEDLDRECTDIGLEDYAFGLLSETVNAIENDRGEDGWMVFFELLPAVLENLSLSGIEPGECQAIQSELLAWRQGFDPSSAEHLLRMKATVDRGRRLAETFSAKILSWFQEPAKRLGLALGVPAHAIGVFCEAEIRRHLVFQLSKIASVLTRRLRGRLGLSAWDVLFGGEAVGRVKRASNLAALEDGFSEPVILVLDHADGDEEIPLFVTGIVLARDIPHLSHLGVRAMQAGVVFVICGEPDEFSAWQRLDGSRVLLRAQPDKVAWSPAPDSEPARQSRIRPVLALVTGAEPAAFCLPLDRVTPESGGGKASGAKFLAELARRPGAGFHTPPAVVVPFGVMESALKAAPEIEEECRRLSGGLDRLERDGFIAAACRLGDLIRRLPVPEELVVQIRGAFHPGARLIVRSSANGEDLDDMAGAGLYESVACTGPEDLAGAIRAVWSSLWTRRAALSRRQAGIPHGKAQMALLVQELLAPDYSFVLHTTNPANSNPHELYAEIAAGLGETLASANAPGNPYRMVCDKGSGAARILAFANFSRAVVPDPAGGLARIVLDYSQLGLSRDLARLPMLGLRLAAIARRVEDACRLPQDIEGAVAGEMIFLVQTRAQQGLKMRGNGGA